MKDLLIVFGGGGLGSVIRYLLSSQISKMHTIAFPFGTLSVNIAACLIMGLIIGLADSEALISVRWRLFWAVGFCGGFSTFSAFSFENLQMLKSGENLSAIAYILLSVLLCLVASFGGMALGNKIEY